MYIRTATLLDQDSIRRIHLSAFPEEEREIVANLAFNMLAEKTNPETFSLVAETNDVVVGHISFSPVICIDTDNFRGYILAPLAVLPQYQRRRIGTNLVEAGLQHLSRMNVDIVFVYGDPQYYGRFGFDANIASGYTPPYQLQYPSGWQAKPLKRVKDFPSSGILTCVSSLRDPLLW